MVVRDGIEPPTLWASITCSTDWAIGPKWRSRRELNSRSPLWQRGMLTTTPRDLVAEIGFEPMTFGLWAQRATRLLYSAIIINGGDGGIRTPAGLTTTLSFQDWPLQPDLGTSPFIYLNIYSWIIIIGGPCRTRTYDQPVMSRLLWPTELKDLIGSERETRTHDPVGMNHVL